MSATPTKPSSAKWTDAEKINLLMSVIAAGGPVNWKNVVLPPGRSYQSCWRVVDMAKKDAAKASGIENGDGGSSPAGPAKKKGGRPKKVVTEGEAGVSTKRKRGKKVVEEVSADGVNADELHLDAYHKADLLTSRNGYSESDDGVTLKKIKKDEEREDTSEEQPNVVKEENSDDSQ